MKEENYLDDRLFAFIINRAKDSSCRLTRIEIHRRWLKALAASGVVVLIATGFGLYGLTQRVIHLRIEHENNRLRAQNNIDREQLDQLKNRVEAVEYESRRLARISGLESQDQEDPGAKDHLATMNGTGGPSLPMNSRTIAEVQSRAGEAKALLDRVESSLRNQEYTPSIWPVAGNLTDGFGGRRNPFGGSGMEFHTGQDIATIWGTPVSATGSGSVLFAGVQTGYGKLVVIDHGAGVTTRYGHLSKIEVETGETVKRGQTLGLAGMTGRSTGPHLHYEVRIYDNAVDPRPYLPDSR